MYKRQQRVASDSSILQMLEPSRVAFPAQARPVSDKNQGTLLAFVRRLRPCMTLWSGPLLHQSLLGLFGPERLSINGLAAMMS